jgi:YVTN family beta-propeller protein
MRTPTRRPYAAAVAALAVLLTAATTGPAGTATPPNAVSLVAAPAASTRDLVLVGNNNAGTVSVIDAHTFARLFDIDIKPDLVDRLAEMTLAQRAGYELVKVQMGGDKFVDDLAVSPDGRTMYVSRSNLADVAAFDIGARQLLWHTRVDGLRADHILLSSDGSRLFVSAVTATKAQAINTADGRIVGSFPTGAYPHGMELSPDGTKVYNASIGVVSLPDWMDPLKGKRVMTVVDSTTLRVLDTIDIGDNRGIRPFQITSDGRYIYAQLSFLHGFVEYDLQQRKITRQVDLPKLNGGETMPTADYPNDSAHHGIALSPDGAKICAAGTVSDYVAIISRPALTVDRIINVGDQPYWAANSLDGQYCFVSNSLSDSLSIISYATATEVARVPVGHYPQRIRTATVPADVLG